MMRTQKIDFPTQQVSYVFPREPADLGPALSELHLDESYPVIVLIGGQIDAPQADATRQAIQTISRIAQDVNALVICGGTDMGIMAEIGQIHSKRGYSFPLVGITPEELVSWKDGPQSTKLLWWGKER
jgi:predicted Rossmann-fold nucleotide-binding protein